MNPLVISGLFQAAQSLIERFFPDPEKKAAAQLQLLQMQQSGELAHLAAETDLVKGQLDINKIEAGSDSIFVAGWRPAVGWIGALGLGYVALVEPFARFIATVCFSYGGGYPVIDTSITLQILGGILGLGAMRSFDKLKGNGSESGKH